MYISLLVFKKALDEVCLCYIVNCEMSQAGINKIHLSTFKENKKNKSKTKNNNQHNHARRFYRNKRTLVLLVKKLG